MAKNKQRKKSSSKASTTGSKTQTTAVQTGAKAKGSASQSGGSTQIDTPRTIGKGQTKVSKLPAVSRRNALRALVASVVVVGAGTDIHRHDVQARILHDLSAVGEGMPSIMQLHSPMRNS